MQENQPKDHFEEFDLNTIRRRKLLPWWIRFFSWVFMIFGGLGILTYSIALFGFNINLSIYGLVSNEPLSLIGLMIISIILLKGWAGFALFFEKDNGPLIGKIAGLVGLFICIASMVFLPFQQGNFTYNIRIEILFLLPFLIRLNRIHKKWPTASVGK